MIYLFTSTDPKTATRLPQTYNGLTINDDSVDYAQGLGSVALYELDVVSIDDQWDAVTEPKVNTHGMEGYKPKKVVTLIREDGVIRAPKGRVDILMDAVRKLNTTFDAVNAWTNDGSSMFNIGYLPLTFSIPTADVAHYPTGLIAAEYYVRALKRPVARTSQFEGDTCRFSLYLQAIDPRCYFATPQTATRSNAGTVTVNNSLAGFPSWPTVLLTATGNGAGKVSISIDGGTAFVINLTGLVTNDIVWIDMERRIIKVNWITHMELYFSGPWLEQPAKSTTWTFANVTGTLAASVVVGWGRAL